MIPSDEAKAKAAEILANEEPHVVEDQSIVEPQRNDDEPHMKITKAALVSYLAHPSILVKKKPRLKTARASPADLSLEPDYLDN